MECPECGWNQLYIGIIINSILALIIAFLFKFVIVPKIERKYERNEFNVHVGIMGFLNSFDHTFKMFYETFEENFGNIKNLPKGEWLPDTHDPFDNEDGGVDFRMKPDSEYFSALETIGKFNELNQRIFKRDEENLRRYAKIIYEYIDKNENYLDPVLRRNIELYVSGTVFYLEWLRKKQNYSDELHKRRKFAQTIISILKKEESSSDKFIRFWKRKKYDGIPQIGEFAKKWKEYLESEKKSNK